MSLSACLNELKNTFEGYAKDGVVFEPCGANVLAEMLGVFVDEAKKLELALSILEAGHTARTAEENFFDCIETGKIILHPSLRPRHQPDLGGDAA